MSNKHDRKMLILLYKELFRDKYPEHIYNVEFEPKKRPIDDLYYIPDILISKKNNIIYWVEVGSLDFDKANKVIEFIGESKFMHIPNNHRIFELNTTGDIYDENGSEILKITTLYKNHAEFDNDMRAKECKLIETALAECHGNQRKAAQMLGFTTRQLRYRIEKLGITK